MAKQVTNGALIEAFLTKTPNPGTQRAYGHTLKKLVEWAQANGIAHLTDVTTPHLHLYASYLESIGNSVNSRHSKQGVVKRFYAYLTEAKIIRATPVPTGWVPSSEAPPTMLALSAEEQDALYEASRSHASFADVGLVIALGGGDGVKLEDIVALVASDVRLTPDGGASIPIRRTDGTIHHRHLTPTSADHLRSVIASRPTGRLLYPDAGGGGPLPKSKLRRHLAAVARAAGVPGEINARRLQRSFKSRVVESGMPVEVMMASLGLQTANVTYTRRLTVAKHGPGTEGDVTRDQAVHQSDALELLRQAENLCGQKGVTAIAPIAIAGSALEMVLRRMCETAEPPIEVSKPSIVAYTDALRSRTLISKPAQGQIHANAKLRNDAVHGVESNDVTVPHARQMIRSVILFLGGDDED